MSIFFLIILIVFYIHPYIGINYNCQANFKYRINEGFFFRLTGISVLSSATINQILYLQHNMALVFWSNCSIK